MKIKFKLNGKNISISSDPLRRLVDILRYDLNLTGTKESCGEGECGACSVLVNGVPVLACLIPAIKIQDSDVLTIEGLSENGNLNYVQRAFVDSGAVQCGYCTPGFIISTFYYIENGGTDNEDSIKNALAGNICRCTGYRSIVDAVKLAIKYRAEES